MKLIAAFLAACCAFGQNYATGQAEGWLILKGLSNNCGIDPRAGLKEDAQVLAVHKRSGTSVTARASKSQFQFPPIRAYPDPWDVRIVPGKYQQERRITAKAKPNIVVPIIVDPVCLLVRPQHGLVSWPPAFDPWHAFQFGSSGEPPPQPTNPPPDAVSGTITAESGKGEGVVTLYGIRLSTASLVPLGRVDVGPDGQFRIPLAANATAGYDHFYVFAQGSRATSFSALLPPDELFRPLEGRLAAAPPRSPVPLAPDPARGLDMGSELIRSLPLAGSRNVDDLLLLAAGVFPGPEAVDLSGPGISAGIGTAGEFSVNGQRSRQNNFVLDGADNTDESTGVRRQGFVLLAPMPVDTVEELQVMTGSADARFGRSSSAQINVLSSSAGGAFHGTVYGYLTDRRFNARNFFDSRPSSRPVALTRESDGVPVKLNDGPLVLDNPVQRDPPFTRTQAGLAIGGPLAIHGDREPRTFFFGAFENQRTRAASESHFAVPTVRQRGFNGNQGRGDTGITGSNGVTLYPSTLMGDAIFSLYPFPNQPAGPFGANTYAAVLPADADGRLYSLKLDRYLHAFRANHVLTLRYGHTGESSDLPALGGALFASAVARVRTDTIAVLFDTNFVEKWASSARFGWGRAAYAFDEMRSPLQSPSTLFPSQPFLLNRPLLLNVSTLGAAEFLNASRLSANPAVGTITQTEEITGAIGRVNVPGFSSIGADTFHFPQHNDSGTFQWAETATRVTARNSLSVGFEIWYLRLNSALDRNARPELTFSGQVLQTLPPAFPGAPPPAVTGLLDPSNLVAAGLIPSYRQTLAGSPDAPLHLQRNQVDFFFQDDVRLAPSLTLTVGGRFQLQHLPGSNDGRFEKVPDSGLFDPSICDKAADPASCQGFIGHLRDAFPAGFQNAFSAPSFHADFRAGLAWDPFGNGTNPIRLSFGTYTGQLPAAILEESRNPLPQIPIDVSSPCDCGPPGPLGNLRNPTFLNILSPGAAQNPVAALALTSPAPNLQFVQPSPNLGPPSTMQYNLGFQHRVSGGGVFSVAYVGAKGLGLLRVADQKALAPPGFAISSIIPLAGPIPEFFSTRVPQFGSGNVSKLLFESSAKSRFDSLQTEFHGTVGHALQFGAAFTWAHSIDDASDFFDTAGAFALPQNNANPSERGSSSFDVRFRGTGYFVWDLPGFSKRALVNGWQLAGIVTAQTGQPFTVNTAFDINGDGLLTDRLATTNGLIGPAVGVAAPNAGRTTRLALAPGVISAALLAQPVGNGVIGRNTFRAGGIATIDLAFSKTFAFKERYRLAWKIESFNTANRANFGVPVRILEAPAFGQAVRTIIPNRTLQIAGTFAF